MFLLELVAIDLFFTQWMVKRCAWDENIRFECGSSKTKVETGNVGHSGRSSGLQQGRKKTRVVGKNVISYRIGWSEDDK